MCWVWSDIVIPLLSAAVGGGLTMLGVAWTLKSQKKESSKIRIQKAKPLLYSLDKMQNYDVNKTEVFAMSEDKDAERSAHIVSAIRNTDNGIGIIKKLTTENCTYYPLCGSIIEKNNTIVLYVYTKDKVENLRSWKLYVEDIYGTEYCYRIDIDENYFKLTGTDNDIGGKTNV